MNIKQWNYPDPSREEMVEHLHGVIQQDTSRESNIDFELEEAIYWFAHNYHGGQGSQLYAALSTSPYKAGLSEPENWLYDELVEHYV